MSGAGAARCARLTQKKKVRKQSPGLSDDSEESFIKQNMAFLIKIEGYHSFPWKFARENSNNYNREIHLDHKADLISCSLMHIFALFLVQKNPPYVSLFLLCPPELLCYNIGIQ